jgi:hypothetical protein
MNSLRVVKALVLTGRGQDIICLTLSDEYKKTFTHEGYTDAPHANIEATANTGADWVRSELGLEPEVVDITSRCFKLANSVV